MRARRQPYARSLVSLLVILPATVRVPRFRAVLVRLSLTVPVLGRLSRTIPVLGRLSLTVPVPGRLRTGIRLTADRGLPGELGTAGGLTAHGRRSEVRLARVRLASHWRLASD